VSELWGGDARWAGVAVCVGGICRSHDRTVGTGVPFDVDRGVEVPFGDRMGLALAMSRSSGGGSLIGVGRLFFGVGVAVDVGRGSVCGLLDPGSDHRPTFFHCRNFFPANASRPWSLTTIPSIFPRTILPV